MNSAYTSKHATTPKFGRVTQVFIVGSPASCLILRGHKTQRQVADAVRGL